MMMMIEKRFVFATNEKWFLFDNEDEEYMDMEDCKDKLNEQQDQISYWKHKVNSLLWILGQFDEEKVKKLLKEIDDE